MDNQPPPAPSPVDHELQGFRRSSKYKEVVGDDAFLLQLELAKCPVHLPPSAVIDSSGTGRIVVRTTSPVYANEGAAVATAATPAGSSRPPSAPGDRYNGPVSPTTVLSVILRSVTPPVAGDAQPTADHARQRACRDLLKKLDAPGDWDCICCTEKLTKANAAILDCNHQNLCKKCKTRLAKCPECRKQGEIVYEATERRGAQVRSPQQKIERIYVQNGGQVHEMVQDVYPSSGYGTPLTRDALSRNVLDFDTMMGTGSPESQSTEWGRALSADGFRQFSPAP